MRERVVLLISHVSTDEIKINANLTNHSVCVKNETQFQIHNVISFTLN